MKFKTVYDLKVLIGFMTKSLFLLIFPGYLIYNLLLLYELIPPFAGGYFGLVSAICFVVYLATSIDLINKNIKTSPWLSLTGIFSFLIALLVTLTSIYYEFSAAAVQSLELLIFWYGFFALGFYLIITNFKNLKALDIVLYSFFAYALFYIAKEQVLMLKFGTSDVDNDAVSGYQGIARNLLVIAFFAVSYAKTKWQSFVKIFITAVLLFLVGARSEFFAFMVAILCLHSLLAFKLKSSFLAIALIFVAGVMAVAPNLTTLSESRQLQVLNLGQSSSWQGRQQMQELALKQISDQPFWGEFGGHTHFGGGAKTETGAYAHNALSGYVNYGVVFIILYMVFAAYSTIFSAVKVFKDPTQKEWQLSFLFTFTVFFLLIFAKPVFWPIIYLGWGVFMGCLYKSKFDSLKIN